MMKVIVVAKTFRVVNFYLVLKIDTLEKITLPEQTLKHMMEIGQFDVLNYKLVEGELVYMQGSESRLIDQKEENFAFILYRMAGTYERGDLFDVYYQIDGKSARSKVSTFALASNRIKIINAKVVRSQLGLPHISALQGTFEVREEEIVHAEGIAEATRAEKAEKPAISEAQKIEETLNKQEFTAIIDSGILSKLGVTSNKLKDRLKESRFTNTLKRAAVVGYVMATVGAIAGYSIAQSGVVDGSKVETAQLIQDNTNRVSDIAYNK